LPENEPETAGMIDLLDSGLPFSMGARAMEVYTHRDVFGLSTLKTGRIWQVKIRDLLHQDFLPTFLRARLYFKEIRPFEYVLFSTSMKSRWGNPLGKRGMPSPSKTGTMPR